MKNTARKTALLALMLTLVGFAEPAFAAEIQPTPLTDEQRKDRLMEANPLAGKGAADLPDTIVPSETKKSDITVMGTPTAPMHHSLGGMEHGTESPSSQAYMEAHGRMMTDMAITYTGDADRDFLNGMVPHHQGALEMAKTELKYGKDPEVRKLAKAIIAAQEREIALMHKLSKKYDK